MHTILKTLILKILKKKKIQYPISHCKTGQLNISIVSNTSDRWSINEFTDTRRIRASFAVHLTDRVLPLTVISLVMPPLRGSLSGDRDPRAMAASRSDEKGTSRERGVNVSCSLYSRFISLKWTQKASGSQALWSRLFIDLLFVCTIL